MNINVNLQTLDMLNQLFSLLAQQFAVFHINANVPMTALPQIEQQIMEEEMEEKHKIILLSTKAGIRMGFMGN